MLTASGSLFVVMLPIVVLVTVVFWAARRTEKTSAGLSCTAHVET